ncbi:MAG: hypothetical protein Q4A74_02935 [Cardiobacteriaceae bacterium]|nr:hypothetical protein [Cardiobacteriaceae bacterium]
MVNLSQLNSLIHQIKEKERVAIVALIDLKTEDNMEKVMNTLNNMSETFNARFKAFESKFEALESKMDSRFEAFESKFEVLESKIDSVEKRLTFLQWVALIGLSALGVLISILRFS